MKKNKERFLFQRIYEAERLLLSLNGFVDPKGCVCVCVCVCP